jgi:hypothetical protein
LQGLCRRTGLDSNRKWKRLQRAPELAKLEWWQASVVPSQLKPAGDLPI